MRQSLPCGKFQSWRGLGARTSAARRMAARPEAGPLGRLLIMFSAFLAGLAVTAQQGSRNPRDLLVSSTLEHIAAADGDAQSSPEAAADTPASPPEQLIVNVRFTNVSERVLDSLRITSPVPADLRYVAQSATGPGSDVLFSVDKGRTFGRPEELTIATPEGVRGAEAADYTHVRWVLRAPLDAGALVVARFRAVPR